jgi:hypothetical protein
VRARAAWASASRFRAPVRGNATVVDLSGTNRHLIGIHVTGTVELTSGGLAHLLIVAKYHIEDDGSVRIHVDRFELKPIGS